MKKRLCSAALALCMALALLPAGALAAGTAGTASIGGKTAQLVTIPMDGSYSGRVVTAQNSVHADMDAAKLVESAVAGTQDRVVAAVNGMFFNSYYNGKQAISFPDNCPLILTNLVQDGRMVSGGGAANSIGFTKDGRVKIDRVDITPGVLVNGKGPIRIWTVNGANKSPDAVVLYTQEVTLPIAVPAAATGVRVKGSVATEVFHGGTVTVGAGEFILVFQPAAATSHAGWSLLPKVGDTVALSPKITAQKGDDWSDMTSIAGGGRMLLHGGKNVAADPAFNATLDADPKQNATSVLQRSFAAVRANGDLMLGTVTGSFSAIAAYLQSAGAVDAVSLDGGASSMLYAAERGYLTRAGRELASALVITQRMAKPAASKVTVNGQPVGMDAYLIDGNNYFKLRDLARVIRGTDKQFEVSWDNGLKAVSLRSGAPYTDVGGELTPGDGKVRPIAINTAPIYADGQPVKLAAYTIEGNNYFKLRDVAKLFNIAVTWDGATGTVGIDTTKPYSDS